jgi:hypothetical protein
MKIYEIECAVTNYAWGHTADESEILPRFNGKSLQEKWIIPKINFTKKKLADFLMFDTGAYLVNERTGDILLKHMKNEIELLPVEAGKFKYCLMNVINVVPCLDEKNSFIKRFNDGRIKEIEKYVFDTTKLKDVFLFKLPQIPESMMLCTNKFAEIVKNGEMLGLDIVEIFDDGT